MAAKRTRRRKSPTKAKTTRRRKRTQGGGTLKTVAVNTLKLGAMAAGGAILGEMARRKLLEPKRDGSESTLAGFERENQGALGAIATAAPGIALGGALYWLGRKQKKKALQTGGSAIMLGSTVLGGTRLLLGHDAIKSRTVALLTDKSAAERQAEDAAKEATPAEGGGGEFFDGHPPAYQQLQGHPPAYRQLQGHPPAYQELGDSYAVNPYGDSYAPSPYGDTVVTQPSAPSYIDRVRRQRQQLRPSHGLSAVDELK